MSDRGLWERENAAYVSAGVEWVRSRLLRLGGPLAPTEGPAAAEETDRRRLFRRRVTPKALLTAPDPSHEEARLAAQMADAERADTPPALVILARRLGLSRFEQDTLLLCAALEFDTRIASLCAHAQSDPTRPYPTFALAAALFDDPAWDLLSPERPLRYWRLLEINQPGAQPLTTSALRADERIVNYIKGLNYLDDRLTPQLIRFEQRPDGLLPPSQDAAAKTIEALVRRASADGAPPPVQLVGSDSISKQLVAQHAAGRLDLNVYRIPAEHIPSQPADLEALARLWQRESTLLPVALYIDAHELRSEAGRDAPAPDRFGPLQRLLARGQGVFLVSVREPRPELPFAHAVDVGKPTAAEQHAAWVDALGEGRDETAGQLAGQYNLNTTAIAEIAQRIRVSGDAERAGAVSEPAVGDLLHERLWAACLERTSPHLDRLARKLHPVATWDDLVLPPTELAVLRQVADQVARRSTVYDDWGFRGRMNRGLGISALFAGESGTGKTMAAEVIANHLRLNLYRIDLSAVVSKYIGETEKNLRRLFDASEDGGAILFFDEADALFGKRSEVRDSHDRYANIEINYLLQRMESYRGLAILATNMKSALDQAFMRRLRFIITFPFPGRPQREAIWRRAWPEDTPLGGLDYGQLARLNLTGGSIANVALNAAFIAASRGSSVTMPVVLEAARSEFRKLERPFDEAEMRWSAPATSSEAQTSGPAEAVA